MDKGKLEELNNFTQEIGIYQKLFEVTKGTDDYGHFIWDNNWIACFKEKLNKVKISFRLNNANSSREYFLYLPKDVVELIRDFSKKRIEELEEKFKKM